MMKMMHLQLHQHYSPPFPNPRLSRILVPVYSHTSFPTHLHIAPRSLHSSRRLVESVFLPSPAPLSRFICRSNGRSDIPGSLEIGKRGGGRKPERQVNGVFWVILVNLGVFLADHFFQVRAIKSLYLYHNWPAWYQFVTATFCHASWEHLSSNLFFLYIFGKLVEEEEGTFALWFSYILTGVGANLVSWLVLPRNAVSVGASGAVFGLFAISVLVKLTWDWRKILEVLILGQFVVEKVMEAAQSSAALSGSLRGGNPGQSVNHIAHLSGALIGVLLVWLVSRIPAPNDDDEVSSLTGKSRKK
ncbi:unnamed protein product [Linum tenue]|uniref:Peptidase S54 rhomboid domain-containing protein n=2 Tax=Linum tenue TaxID=586396 RepID=A0AAV0JGN7_9ROSI|nr:unnamed protein product [Linum tenue]